MVAESPTKSAEEPAPRQWTASELDAFTAEHLASGKNADARAWLASPKSMLFSGDRQQVSDLVEALHRAGCPRVLFTDINPIGDREVSASIVAEWPREANARAAAFTLVNKFLQEALDADPQKDVGQRYGDIRFD